MSSLLRRLIACSSVGLSCCTGGDVGGGDLAPPAGADGSAGDSQGADLNTSSSPDGAGGGCGGATLFVAPGGSDTASGRSKQSAFATIQHAVDAAAAGDVICVGAGIYRERIRIRNRSGTAGSPIVLTAEPGAIVDGGSVLADDGSAVNSGWVQVASGDAVLPNGDLRVWKKTFKVGGIVPSMMTLDQGSGSRYVLRIGQKYDYTTWNMDNGIGADRLQNGPCQSDTFGGSPCVHDWSPIHALFGVKCENGGNACTVDGTGGALYVRFEDGSTPNGKTITFAPRRIGAVHLVDSDYWRIEKLALRNADMGVFIDSGSDHVTVSDTTVTTCSVGIMAWPLADPNSLPQAGEIRNNDVTWSSLSNMSPTDPQHWFIWQTIRIESKVDFDGGRYGISLFEAGDDFIVDHNHVHDVFATISMASFTAGATDRLRRTVISDNTVEHGANEGLSLYQAQDSRVFGNRISDVNSGFRLGVVPGPGPIYVYENTIWNTDIPESQAENQAFYLFSPSLASISVYHNSFSVGRAFVYGGTPSAAGSGICAVNPGYCAPNMHVYNNIFSVLAPNAANATDWRTASAKPMFDYNWISVAPDNSLVMSGTHNVVASASMWPRGTDPYPFDPSASAQEIGLDLSANNPVCGGPCPGMAPGYFEGSAPAAGAVQPIH